MAAISIVIPIYNSEKFIHRCLDSIISQTFKNWECILIDDGSQDDSGYICDEYAKKDKRFKVIHQKNAGSASARNVGLQNSYAKYTAFVDSDDYIENNYLEKLYYTIETNDTDLIICGYVKQQVGKKEKITQTSGLKNAESVFEDFLSGQIKGYLWNKLFKNEIIELHSIKFCEGHNLWEDNLFVLQYLHKSNKIYFISDCIYNYNREIHNNLSRSLTSKKFDDVIFSLNYIYDFLVKNHIYIKYKNLFLYRCVNSKIIMLRNLSKWDRVYDTIFTGEEIEYMKNDYRNGMLTLIAMLISSKHYTLVNIIYKVLNLIKI